MVTFVVFLESLFRFRTLLEQLLSTLVEHRVVWFNALDRRLSIVVRHFCVGQLLGSRCDVPQLTSVPLAHRSRSFRRYLDRISWFA